MYTVSSLGNIWGARPVRYVNTTSDKLKEAVVTVRALLVLQGDTTHKSLVIVH